MAGLGLQDDAQSADGQLQLGLQLIQQSYNRRVEELTREVEHWKRVAQHHKQQEAQTREELGKSNQRGAELQRQLGEKNTEVQQLTEARNVALNQIATLKKHASQLQSFKKNISNMLQVRVRPRRPHHPLAAPALDVATGESVGRLLPAAPPSRLPDGDHSRPALPCGLRALDILPVQSDPGMDTLGLQGMIDNLPQTIDTTFTSNM